MNFQESVDYLLSLGFELSVKKFGLENTITLLEALGNPQEDFVKVQVAGTNGKGSTCAFLEGICRSAGIPVGVNTSPHLVTITERVRIDGQDISEKDFARYATEVRRVSEELVQDGTLGALPTYFEHVTAIAQLAFRDEGVKIAILETGLGGRFDATTATNAEIVAFTPIAMDHVKTLGPTLRDIASEKAAIIRHDTRVISVPQNDTAERVIREKCIESGVEPIWAEAEIGREKYDVIHLKTETANYAAIFLYMPGEHQWTNATLAIHIAENLRDWGFELSKGDIEEGIEWARHPGRLEYDGDILYDGAHNTEGARALKKYFKDREIGPVTMVFALMRGKSVEEVGAALFPLAGEVICTRPVNPRALDANELAEEARKHLPKDAVHVVEDPAEAISFAREIAGDDLVLVTGSLYLIGEVKAALQNRKVQRRKRKKG